jgi:hypothetical protein
MTNFRKGLNGILVAPRRGKPPPAPEGYEEVPGYRFQYRLIIPDCEHRYLDDSDCIKCPRSSPKMACKVVERVVTRTLCHECGAVPAIIKEKYRDNKNA